jgi:serine/threonine protein kinase
MKIHDSAPEDRLAEALADVDDALAAGLYPGVQARGDSADPDPLTGHWHVLTMLERVWPRHGCADDRGGVARATLPPPELARFRVVRELGRGGMGVVYLADDTRLGRQVALKVPRPEVLLRPALRGRFLREARAAARLRHPNVVPVFDSSEAGALCYIVSAYCPGGSLAAYLRERGAPLPARPAAAVVAVLAHAVQHVHACGIVHRDLKPANVLLECGSAAVPAPEELAGLVRLTDFGLAKFLDVPPAAVPHADAVGTLTPAVDGASNGSIATVGTAGTPSYMAPEQAAGPAGAVGPFTDVYALGAMLYELLTGRPPFAGATMTETLTQVRFWRPVPPSFGQPAVPRDLDAICLKCLDKEPDRRYSSARALADDLERFVQGQAVLVRPTGKPQRPIPWAGCQAAVAATVLVIALALFGVPAVWPACVQARHARSRYKPLAQQPPDRGRPDGSTTQRLDRVARAEEPGRVHLVPSEERASASGSGRCGIPRLSVAARSWRGYSQGCPRIRAPPACRGRVGGGAAGRDLSAAFSASTVAPWECLRGRLTCARSRTSRKAPGGRSS